MYIAGIRSHYTKIDHRAQLRYTLQVKHGRGINRMSVLGPASSTILTLRQIHSQSVVRVLGHSIEHLALAS